MEQPRTPLLQSVDDATRALARRLVRATRHGALAVLEPVSGWPLASRNAQSRSALTGSPCPVYPASAWDTVSTRSPASLAVTDVQFTRSVERMVATQDRLWVAKEARGIKCWKFLRVTTGPSIYNRFPT